MMAFCNIHCLRKSSRIIVIPTTSVNVLWDAIVSLSSTPTHGRLCRVKNMLAMYLKYHKAGLTPTTPVTSIAISPVKMSIGRKSLTNLRSGMIFYIFLPSTPPY